MPDGKALHVFVCVCACVCGISFIHFVEFDTYCQILVNGCRGKILALSAHLLACFGTAGSGQCQRKHLRISH